jgi:anthranilate synthase component 1
MESPFDIAADLDTPVSAYMKLKPFAPRFLLESVESGERLARYSFIGLGSSVTVELYPDRLSINGKNEPRPTNAAQWQAMMRGALARAPLLKPQIDGIPFDGGLVGTTGYDVVRFFERLPPNRAEHGGLPQAVYVAHESLLVFDHLSRRVALLHAGSESERQALRSEVVKTLRGGLDAPTRPGKFSPATASMTQREHAEAVRKGKEHIKAGDIYQIVLSVRFAGRTDLDPFQT